MLTNRAISNLEDPDPVLRSRAITACPESTTG